jgi:hypothetical protein
VEEVVPGGDEGEHARGHETRQDEREKDLPQKARTARPVDVGGSSRASGTTLTKPRGIQIANGREKAMCGRISEPRVCSRPKSRIWKNKGMVSAHRHHLGHQKHGQQRGPEAEAESGHGGRREKGDEHGGKDDTARHHKAVDEIPAEVLLPEHTPEGVQRGRRGPRPRLARLDVSTTS